MTKRRSTTLLSGAGAARDSGAVAGAIGLIVLLAIPGCRSPRGSRPLSENLTIAEGYLTADEPLVARPLYEEILRRDPGNTAARLGLARVAVACQEYALALEHLRLAENARSPSPEELEAITIIRARTYARMQKPPAQIWDLLYPVWRTGSARVRTSLDAEIKALARALPPDTDGRADVLSYVALRRPSEAREVPPAGDIELREDLPQIKILPRSAWRPTRRANGWDLQPLGRPYRITIHHSAHDGAATTHSQTEAADLIRKIQRYHMEENGWADLGYHFVIDGQGQIWEGRSLRYQGAHAGGANNRGNIGIVLLGDFNHRAPAAQQLQGLKTLLNYLRMKYRIRRDQLFGHSHFKATDCPGRYLNGILTRLRAGA